MSNPKERYVVVTCISQFRQRYAIPVSELQALNPDVDISADPAKQIEWASDNVTCEKVSEFSQKWIGESIVDAMILDEERIVNLFDRDNDYLKEWTRQQKLDYISDWEEKDESL